MSAKTKVYIKLGVLGLIVLYGVAFVLINLTHITEVWLLPFLSINSSVLWVILITVALTLSAHWIVRQVRSSVKQLHTAVKPGKTDNPADK
jgi:hypothetical protein